LPNPVPARCGPVAARAEGAALPGIAAFCASIAELVSAEEGDEAI